MDGMIPLQAAPPIPDAGTLDRIVGPFGATVVLAIACAVLLWGLWKIMQRSHGQADKYEEKLTKLHEDHAGKLVEMVRDGTKADMELAAAVRELTQMLRSGRSS